MPNTIGIMLAGWPLLYSEIAGTEVQNVDYHAAKVREEVVRPLLDTEDFLNTFEGRPEAYQGWKESLARDEPGPEAMLEGEGQFDGALAATFEEHRDVLGEQTVRGVREIVNLRRIVRESVIPYRETWPEESWERIAHLMVGSELCLAGIVECLATGEGNSTSALELAKLGFQHALDAYWDAGYYGQHSTKLEDIPE